MREPESTVRVAVQRADPKKLLRYRVEDRERPLAFERWDESESDDRWYLGLELSRTPEKLRQIVLCDSDEMDAMHRILDIQLGEPVPDLGDGHCELGTVLSSEDYYDYGCDIASLQGAGLELSWEAAQWLHAAGRAQLVRRGKVYGSLTPDNIRLNLFYRPTPEAPDGYTEHYSDDDALPPVFAFESYSRDCDPATDLAAFARAIALLTKHPDPTIDGLLRQPASCDVLRDLLLQRGGPVETLLGDAAEVELDWLPLPDGSTIGGEPADEEQLDDELSQMWHLVLRLDPMIDTSDPEIFEIPGPYYQ